MRDLSLLNELEIKIREMVAALEREKARNAENKDSSIVSLKLRIGNQFKLKLDLSVFNLPKVLNAILKLFIIKCINIQT